jgi:hypothetical protein
MIVCRILGLHRSGYEEFCFLEDEVLLHARLVLVLLFNPEVAGDCLRNIGWPAMDYTALYPRRRIRQIPHFWEYKLPLMVRNIQKKFSFFNKNSTPVFKLYARMRPQSTCFHCLLKLMFKIFHPNFKYRWQIYCVMRNWETHFHMFDSLTIINCIYLLLKL